VDAAVGLLRAFQGQVRDHLEVGLDLRVDRLDAIEHRLGQLARRKLLGAQQLVRVMYRQLVRLQRISLRSGSWIALNWGLWMASPSG